MPLIDFTAPLDSTALVAEVAAGTFAFKNKIKGTQIRALWDNLSVFIISTLQRQKGVLLPNLGNFKVGPVVGDSTQKKIRPSFSLLEGRYGGVSQKRPRYIIGGRSPIVQPNYGLLSVQAAVHRGATQRLVGELLQRLGVHILSGRPLKVEFPGLGSMVTNRSGRFEFIFAPLFMEFFEREVYANVKEMDLLDAEKRQVLKGLQHVHLANPPYILSPAGSRPQSAATPRPCPGRPTSGFPSPPSPYLSPPAKAVGEGLRQGSPASLYNSPPSVAGGEERQATPQHDQLQALMRLCSDLDKKSSGCIPRLALEGFLHREVRPLLTQIDGATMLDLLENCTFDGKSSKLILFKPFLATLRQALKNSQGQQPKALHPYYDDADEDEVINGGPPHDEEGQDQRSDISFQDMLPHQQQHHQAGPTPGMPAAAMRPPVLNLASPPMGMPGHPNQQPLISALHPDPNQYLHYEQAQLSPRSRAEYDSFNRAHFLQLNQVRGPQGKRAVTPKVGEEPLNYREFQAVRASSPYRSRANTPQAPEGSAQPPLPSPQLIPPYHVDHFPLPSAGFAPPSSKPIPRPASAPRNSATSHHQAPSESHPFALPQQQTPPPPPQQQQQQQQEQQQHHHHQQHKSFPVSPYRPNPGYSVAPHLPAPVTPVRQSTLPRQIQPPSAEILDCMHDPVPGLSPPKPPTPQSFSPPPHISQYDIINAAPHERARLKAELKQQLQEDWKRQIQEKSEMEASVVGAGHSWPYTPVRDPNDKRPLSAISRPLSPRGAHTRSPAWHI